jgi:hypothetical protein
MDGRVPVGYSPRDRKLLVNKKAKQVGRIFELYLELGCVKDQLDREGVKARCASARLVKSQEGSIKGCFRREDGCPLEISSSFLAGVPSRASSSGICRCTGLWTRASAGHTAGWTIPKIITFTLRGAESCD